VRVLVVYGSSRGGTAGLASMVAEAFVARRVRADVGDASDVGDLIGYDAIVVGGALYHDRWHPEATSFVERNLDGLLRVPVWFFSSGPLDDTARSGSLAPVDQVRDLARDADIRGHMTFGGVLEKRPHRLSSVFAWGRTGDFRDRQQVHEWVGRIIAGLRTAPPAIEPPSDPQPEAATKRRFRGRRAGGRDDSEESGRSTAGLSGSADDDLGLDVLTDS
jgi:menaquinone-dependent protoporphyrinogen oxidase